MTHAGDPLQRRLAGHPAGLYLVAFTEMWERFSYWGFAGIFVLFLTTAPAQGGWGWQDADAMRLYGWYGGLAFIVPVLGAWLANNTLGERRCIQWGAVLITLGHACIALLWLGPELIRLLSGHDVGLVLRQADVVLGLPFPGEAVQQGVQRALDANGLDGSAFQPVLLAYLVKSWAFFLGLLLIVAGTGLLKPAISSIVAALYPSGGVRRDEGFAYFFVGIYIGALLGALVAGFLGERLGWHYGLTAAGLGMACGLAAYLAKQKPWLGQIGTAPLRASADRSAPLSRAERERLLVIVVQGLFTVVYAAGFYQMFALLNLYAHTEVDRRIGGFEIPTTWLQTINLWSFFVCIPLLARLWRRLAGSGRNPSASWKLASGIGALAAGYAILALGENARAAGQADIAWLVATYLLFGLGDALVWPGQISLTSKLAPARYTALAVGAWYVCIGIGTWLAGYVGAVAAPFPFEPVFVALAIALAALAGLLALLTPWLKRLMHGCEAPSGPAEEGASRAARSGMRSGGAGQDPSGRAPSRTDSSAA